MGADDERRGDGPGEVGTGEGVAPLAVPGEMRDLAERSLEGARRAFGSFAGAARQAAGALPAVPGAPALVPAALRAVGFAERSVGAALDLARDLARAQGLEEVTRLQAAYLAAQGRAVAEEARAMAGLAGGAGPAGEDAPQPREGRGSA